MPAIPILINTTSEPNKRGVGMASKTTHNYALKRNLELESTVIDDLDVLLVKRIGREPLFVLFECENGSYSWKQNVMLPDYVKEELPAFYPDEKSLRLMLDYVGRELEYELVNR